MFYQDWWKCWKFESPGNAVWYKQLGLIDCLKEDCCCGINILVYFLNYESFLPNLYYLSIYIRIFGYVSDRDAYY